MFHRFAFALVFWSIDASTVIESLEVFRRVIALHRGAAEFHGNLKQVHLAMTAREPAQRLHEMAAFIAVHVRDHFAYEEEHLFPALLAISANSSTVSLVCELREEHQSLLAIADQLDAALAVATPSSLNELLAVIEPEFARFFDDLQRHASKEDKLLIPMIESLQQQ